MIFPYQINGGLNNGRKTLDGEVKSMSENLCEIEFLLDRDYGVLRGRYRYHTFVAARLPSAAWGLCARQPQLDYWYVGFTD